MINKRIEIVTPVRNRREITLQCLRSLFRVDRTSLEIHIVVVDDGSTDGTAEAIRSQFPEVELITGDGGFWYTEGTNVGIKAALDRNPDYVLCINDDSIFDVACIKRLVERAESTPRTIIGGLLILWNSPHRVFQVAPYWSTWRGGWQHWYHQTIATVPKTAWEVEAIVGNCVLYPRKLFAEIGLMNPSISAQYGDLEFTTRARKNGWRLLIEPSARVYCMPNNQPTSALRQPLSKAVEILLLNTKNGSNMIHRFRQMWHTAPSKPNAVAGFGMFHIHWLKRKLFGGTTAIEPRLIDRDDSLRLQFEKREV